MNKLVKINQAIKGGLDTVGLALQAFQAEINKVQDERDLLYKQGEQGHDIVLELQREVCKAQSSEAAMTQMKASENYQHRRKDDETVLMLGEIAQAIHAVLMSKENKKKLIDRLKEVKAFILEPQAHE